jgi:hypothetical protein
MKHPAKSSDKVPVKAESILKTPVTPKSTGNNSMLSATPSSSMVPSTPDAMVLEQKVEDLHNANLKLEVQAEKMLNLLKSKESETSLLRDKLKKVWIFILEN